MFVSFYRWLSLLFLFPFSRFLFVSLSLFPPLVLFLCLLLFLFLSCPSFCCLVFSSFSTSLPSFPYLSLRFIPVVGLSSFSSSPSFSPSFSSFLFPFGSLVFPFLPFSPFPQFLSSSFVSVSFPVPSSPLLTVFSSCWSKLSPLCCVPL